MSAPRDEADREVSHDAWLREALRHAPDADALPPRKLSETILRQARAAAEMPPTSSPLPSFGQRVAAAWAWLGRPPVAAGFASVMVAGVVGLMWWDRSIEESLPPRDAAVPAAAQAPPAPLIATAPAPTPSPAPATRAADAAPPAPPSAEPTRPAAPAPRRAAPPAIAQAPARESPAATATPPTRAPMPDTTPAAGAAAGPAPRPAESAAVADAAPPAAPAPAAALAERDARTRAAAAERNEQARSATALSKAAAPALRRDPAAPVTALRSAVAAQPERWRWRREAGELRLVEPEFESWLGHLETATASRWQADPLDAAAVSRAEAASLQLWLDGRLHGTLRLDAGGVGYEAAAPAPTARQRAELPATAAAALRTALDQVTR